MTLHLTRSGVRSGLARAILQSGPGRGLSGRAAVRSPRCHSLSCWPPCFWRRSERPRRPATRPRSSCATTGASRSPLRGRRRPAFRPWRPRSSRPRVGRVIPCSMETGGRAPTPPPADRGWPASSSRCGAAIPPRRPAATRVMRRSPSSGRSCAARPGSSPTPHSSPHWPGRACRAPPATCAATSASGRRAATDRWRAGWRAQPCPTMD